MPRVETDDGPPRVELPAGRNLPSGGTTDSTSRPGQSMRRVSILRVTCWSCLQDA